MFIFGKKSGLFLMLDMDECHARDKLCSFFLSTSSFSDFTSTSFASILIILSCLRDTHPLSDLNVHCVFSCAWLVRASDTYIRRSKVDMCRLLGFTLVINCVTLHPPFHNFSWLSGGLGSSLG